MQIEKQNERIKKTKLIHLFKKTENFSFSCDTILNVQKADFFESFVHVLLITYCDYKYQMKRIDYFLFIFLKFLAVNQKDMFFLTLEQAEIYK